MIHPALISLCLALLLPLLLSAQESPTAGQLAVLAYQNGEQALLDGKLKAARQEFERALKYKPDMPAARRGLGFVYEQEKQFALAIEQYERVFAADSTFSRTLYYHVGELAYKLGDAAKALGYFAQFEALQDIDSDRFGNNSAIERESELKLLQKLPGSVKACQISLDSSKFVNITEVVNMGPAINTPEDEVFPLLSNDQRLLFFNRSKKGKNEDLYFANIEGEAWMKARSVRNFNTSESEGMCTMVRDGRTIFFTACMREGSLGNCDIWEAKVNGREVLSATPLDGLLNSEHWDSQASISCDGSVMYFASNRPGGLGGTDIWMSTRLDNGTWGSPVNMGPKINTPEDEESPFITNDGKTLYFSSTGHLGMGEQDIFMSWLDERTQAWSVPINLGPPVNSAFRELGFFLSADGRTGYFASERTGGFGGMDIYSFALDEKLYSDPITYVEGYVRDSVLLTPVRTTVKINGRPDVETDEQGRFFLCVEADDVLDLSVQQKTYHHYRNQFSVPDWNNKSFYAIELLLTPTISFVAAATTAKGLPKDTLATAPPPPKPRSEKTFTYSVYFGFDSREIQALQVDGLADFIAPFKNGIVQRVDIIGYADDVGSDPYNLRLSEERAKAIALFLIQHNVVVDQIYLEGKGSQRNSEPKDQNRRVDIKVTIVE